MPLRSKLFLYQIVITNPVIPRESSANFWKLRFVTIWISNQKIYVYMYAGDEYKAKKKKTFVSRTCAHMYVDSLLPQSPTCWAQVFWVFLVA